MDYFDERNLFAYDIYFYIHLLLQVLMIKTVIYSSVQKRKTDLSDLINMLGENH